MEGTKGKIYRREDKYCFSDRVIGLVDSGLCNVWLVMRIAFQ